jgi:hypothetical protein
MWKAAQNRPGWRSRVDLNFRDPSISRRTAMVSIPQANGVASCSQRGDLSNGHVLRW